MNHVEQIPAQGLRFKARPERGERVQGFPKPSPVPLPQLSLSEQTMRRPQPAMLESEER
jgi:hypothetical protein